MAFKKANRLNRDGIRRIFRKGEYFKGDDISMRTKNNSSLENKFAVVISSRAIKKAVIRNKTRRIITEYLRKKDLMKSSYDIVIYVNKEIEANSTHIIKALDQLLKRAGLK